MLSQEPLDWGLIPRSAGGSDQQRLEDEVDAINLRPHPYEFCLYYDI